MTIARDELARLQRKADENAGDEVVRVPRREDERLQTELVDLEGLLAGSQRENQKLTQELNDARDAMAVERSELINARATLARESLDTRSVRESAAAACDDVSRSGSCAFQGLARRHSEATANTTHTRSCYWGLGHSDGDGADKGSSGGGFGGGM